MQRLMRVETKERDSLDPMVKLLLRRAFGRKRLCKQRTFGANGS
jgi:hypothetical protein